MKVRKTMFVIGLATLLAIAFVNPTAARAGTLLPPGTLLNNLGEATLHVQKDILILPNSKRVVFKSGAAFDENAISSYPMCSLEVKAAVPRGRLLKSGARNIRLTGAVGDNDCHGGACWIRLLVAADDQTIASVLCADSMDRGQGITLKVLEDAFGSYLSVETAAPDNGLF